MSLLRATCLFLLLALVSEALGGKITLREGPNLAKGEKIIGGFPVGSNPYDWMVYVNPSDGDNSYICGGTMVSSRWMLTAAHCSIGMVASKSMVLIGAYDVTTDGNVVGVARIEIHPSYDKDNNLYDFAMWKLADGYAFSGETIHLDQGNATLVVPGTETLVMGWGTTISGDSNSLSDVLRETTLEISTDASCEAYYSGAAKMNMDVQVCAGYAPGGKDTCQGDSGGPLLVSDGRNLVQVGVVSYGDGCGMVDVPGVYARTAGVKEWLVAVQNSSAVLVPSMFFLVAALFLQFFKL